MCCCMPSAVLVWHCLFKHYHLYRFFNCFAGLTKRYNWKLVRCFLQYRLIHKSLQDFWPLRYSNRDGHVEGEHVNRGRDTPSFCPTLQVLDMSTLGDAADVKFGNFGKFQYTERFLIACPHHVSPGLPP
jgi:hypothetical protein